ncbi:tyrosine-type recombinase/integrase [Rhodomicrobium vannielii ATCC 17100]|uniref:tyrosine-type recombinase/integrase n=1 Tax=Rhodomicrobium vannielii TaxID=1069 RepID=UPI00191B4DD1|nr:tyrosine-type recombinase/integrase [Rhodomicrobium vannielii ATCC 17100]
MKLPGEPAGCDGLPNAEWWQAYRELCGEEQRGPKTGTFAALIGAYKASPEWKELSAKTRENYVRYLSEIEATWGELRAAGVDPRHVLALRDRKSETPAAANYIVRVLSTLLSWSIPRGYRHDNPCKHVKMLKGGDGYEPWSWEQIIHFRDHVSKRELWWVAALALYSGQRQGDDLAMLWSDVSDGSLAVVQQKTGKKLRIAMHRDLRELLQEIPKRAVTVLSNTRGKPWTTDGFKASWGKELDRDAMAPIREAGLVFHGLRKSAVVFLLEAGCTDAEVSAITGQSRQMVEYYARQVNQKKLAANAVLKWEASGVGGTTGERDL